MKEARMYRVNLSVNW